MNDISDRSLSFTRIFDAPRELVWQAWTAPQHALNWWGPDGFTNTNIEMDVRPGGVWRFVMHGPDGVAYKNRIQFIEVVKPERLVYAHCGEDETEDIHFHTTVTFEDQAGKTQLKMQMVFNTAQELRRVVEEFGAEEGAHQHLANLATYLETMSSDTEQRQILSLRVLNAPRELVWRALSEPAHLACWWGPNGFRNTFHAFDLRPGGHWRFIMHGPDGTDYPNHSVFVEVSPPFQLTFDHMGVPLFRATITLEQEGNKTRMTFRMVFDTVETYDRVKVYAIPGNEQNFDRLAAHLETMQCAAS